MRALLLAGLLLAGPTALADKKLDEAVAKAEEQLKKGKPDDALKTMRKAAEQARSDPAGQRALARLQERLGDLDSAGASYAKAVEIAAAGAARAAALADLAEHELRVGPARGALVHARQAVEAQASAPALAALGRIQARLGDAEALANAKRAAAADARSAAAQVALGEALLAAGKPADAAEAFRQAQQLDARNPTAASGLALALAEQGQAQEAVAAARAAVALDEKRGESLVALALALIAQDPRDLESKAIAEAQQGVFLEPANARLKLLLGRVFEARVQLDQALGAYAEAAALEPGWDLPKLARLRIHYLRHQPDPGLADIAQFPPALAQSAEVAVLHARLLLLKERPADAAAALERAAAALKSSAEAQATLGSAYYAAGQSAKAAAAYKAAAELEPDNETYAANYALFLGYAGRAAEGAEVMSKLTKRAGYKGVPGFINLGWLYRAMKPARVDQSVAAYKRALALEPGNGQAALGIALAYYRGKRWNEAIRAFENTARVDKRLEGDAQLGIGWAHYFKRDMPQARAFAQKARNAGNPDADELQAAVGKYEEAVKYGEPEVRRAINRVLIDQQQSGLGDLVEQLGSGTTAQQLRAASALCKRGGVAASHLGYALRKSDLEAREAIVPCLAAMGAAARPALASLEYLVNLGPPPVDPGAPAERVRIEVREAALVSAMQAAVTRIKGGR